MTPRQKRIIGVLAVANGVIVLTLILFATRLSGGISSVLLPTPVPTYPSEALSSQECQQRALRMVSQAGLGGTATVIPGESLWLNLVYPMAPGDDLDDAAQQVWTAFDIATALTEDRCDIIPRVEVQIEPQPQGAEGRTRLRASVDVANLKAFYGGELTQNEFIDRVEYEADPADRQ